MEEIAGDVRLVAELHRVDLADLVEHPAHEGDGGEQRERCPQHEADGAEPGGRDRVPAHDAPPGRLGRAPKGMGDHQPQEGEPPGYFIEVASPATSPAAPASMRRPLRQ